MRGAAGVPLDGRDELWLDAVKYLFVAVIESVVDVAQHIGSSEGFPAPDSNSDAVRLLSRGVVEDDLADSLARAVGFRNVLLHRYAEVDDELAPRYQSSDGARQPLLWATRATVCPAPASTIQLVPPPT